MAILSSRSVVSQAPDVYVFSTWTLPEPGIVVHSPESGSQVKIWFYLQTFRDPPVTLLVCVRSAESLRHQRESQTWVHRICWGHYVWDLQRHLPCCAAEHAHSHDEQLLPAHCRKLSHSLSFCFSFSLCASSVRLIPSVYLLGCWRLQPPVFDSRSLGFLLTSLNHACGGGCAVFVMLLRWKRLTSCDVPLSSPVKQPHWSPCH